MAANICLRLYVFPKQRNFSANILINRNCLHPPKLVLHPPELKNAPPKMPLHPLISKGGAFVLKLGLVFKQKDHPRGGLSVWYGIGAEGIEEELVLIFSQYSCTINQYWKD
jgi:hypothetical protein